jgi:hypothetical protein
LGGAHKRSSSPQWSATKTRAASPQIDAANSLKWSLCRNRPANRHRRGFADPKRPACSARACMSMASQAVRELTGGKSSVYRIVGRRKDIKEHRRFAKIDNPLPLPTRAARASRKPAPTATDLSRFVARVEKEARERAPKGVEKARARMRRGRARA